MVSSTYNICLTAFLLGLSNAHLILKSPVPYGADTINNSPLVNAAIGSSGSDFPCKQRPGVYKISQMNNMAVGESQTLSFTGSASHGGGTCQLAVSLDHEPTTNSTWKLIQVYEGGCPVTASGNGGTDTFIYKIPQGFPNGQASLAWTWYNRVGNREIYMNCAPITVTGGADNQDFYNTLPDMYIINLPTSDCSTVESSNQLIPNPGQFVIKGDTADKLVAATGPSCAAAAAAQTAGVKAYQAASSDVVSALSSGSMMTAGATTSAGVMMTAGATSAVITTTAAAYNNGQYSQPISSASVTQPTSLVAVTSSTAVFAMTPVQSSGFLTLTSVLSLMVTAPASSSTVVAASTSTAGDSGSNSMPYKPGTALTGNSCSQNGAVVCNGPSQFGLCNNGQVVWQSVAAGTTCTNGVIQRRGEDVEETRMNTISGRFARALRLLIDE